MMAFFLLLWLVSVFSESTLQGVAQYFTPTESISDKAGLGFDGGTKTNIEKGIGAENAASSSLIYGSPSKGHRVDAQNSDLKNYSDNLQMDITNEGLRIQIIDSDNRPMFKPNTSELQPYIEKIITVIGKIVSNQPNYISISGHTASIKDNKKQVVKIVGRADREPFDYKDPYSVQNIRVGITLLNEDSISEYQKSIPNVKNSGCDEQKLLPSRRGPKPRYKDLPLNDGSIEKKVLDYRKHGYNKFVISEALKKDSGVKSACSASTVYRILAHHGESCLRKKMVEEKRKIIREYKGSLGHIDCHILPKSIVKTEAGKRYYVVGCIDDYSRVVWVEVVSSLKALDICFAMMDIILIKHQRYDIKYEEILSDNGSEFCGGKDLMSHPFERLMSHFDIKHRRTKPYRPQTNGKIERFWRSFDDEVIEGAEYETLDELKDSVLGYNFDYNENRPHQSLNGKTPEMMAMEAK
ncbi:unnamed protein product [Rotaria magnacalcarata]|uniref:Integrase catalytic domain-containing protein n=1 Tax=Rotaria magnacalcarata TaxID=392030 RepID=A0A819BBH8_9BILA|nr:unnamed protein product [Rotaria magnacalcarata]